MKKKLFILGLLSSLAFAPLYFFPTLFFSLKYLLETIIDCKDNKKVFYYGWLFGFGYFIGNCYWYCHSMLMWPYYPFIPIAITIIPAFLALYTALTAFSTKKISDNLKLNDFFIVLIFSLLWTFFEYLRGILLTGFPWNLIGYSLGFSNILIQTVHIFGSYIFGFFCLNMYTFFYIKKHNKYTLFYYITLSTFILFYGIFTYKKEDLPKNILAIKTNISVNDERSDYEILDEIINKTLKYDLTNTEYIVWPEAVIPSIVNQNIINYISDKIKDKFIISGAIRLRDNKIFNSVFVFKNGEIIDYYDKYKLVPFGEYIPFKNLFSFLTAVSSEIDISKGNIKNGVLNIENKIKFSPLICYESIFTNMIDKNVDFILNITNDAWFGKTSGPYQHLIALKFRAIENRISAFRVSNGGLNVFIDKYGNITKIY